MESGQPQRTTTDEIHVLHLDDNSDLTDLTATFLERESDNFRVATETSPTDALERVTNEPVDCIVSDYDMPEMDGLAFLDKVREVHPDLPFILFTGKGSEEIASEAISRGVTDYLQKGTGSDQYTVLANRIKNAVSQYNAEKEVEKRSKWYGQIMEHSSDYVMIVDGMGEVTYVSPSIERVMGYSPDDIVGSDSFQNIHPDDLEYAANALSKTIEYPDREVTVEFRATAADGSVRWLESRGRNFLDDSLIGGVMVNVRDITERKLQEKALKRRKDRLQQLTTFLSHDIKNQLSVIESYSDIAKTECDDADEELDHIQRATDRIEQLIEKVKELARSEQEISQYETVDLGALVEACWTQYSGTAADSTLVVDAPLTVEADSGRLQSLLENLLANAVAHTDGSVTVRVGPLDDGDGFYVEDNGQGIDPDHREHVFDPDYTTAGGETGLGLTIVQQVVAAHDWEVSVTESDAGGARFEVTNVDCRVDTD